MPAGKDQEPGTRAPRFRWLRRHRRLVAGVVLVAVVAVRVALPGVLRSVLVSQANAALAGRVEVGDVDLWLLRGGIALEDVALRGEQAGPGERPLVGFRRLYVRVGWLPFLRHTVRIDEIALDGLELNVERLKNGAFVLPGTRETSTAVKPEVKPEPAAPAKPWSIVIAQTALHDGHLRLRDHVVEPPEDAELALDDLKLADLAFQPGPDTTPGHGVLEAEFGDGTVRVEIDITTRPEGFAVAAKIDVANLPLDRTSRHVPQLGWVGFAGRLDAALTVHAEPGRTPVAGGTLTLRDLQADVPGVEGPALAWRRFEVAIDTLDVETRKVEVTRVSLDGAVVVMRPREPVLLPLLAGLLGKKDDAAPAPPSVPAKPAPPWRWRVAAVEITDSVAKLFLEPPPLDIGITKATVTGLSSEPGSSATVALELKEGDGTLALHGTVGLDPLAARLTAHLERLALGRLVATTGAAPVLLPGGVLDGDLTIAAEKEPLVVSGQLALTDLKVTPREGQDFALGWKRLELGLREVRVPGVLPGAPAGFRAPLRVDLERLRLVAPSVALTRTPEGLVLPTASPPAGAPAAAPPPAAEKPAAAPPPPDGTPLIMLALGKLDLEDGQVTIVDRSVKPFYRGTVSAIAFKASGLHYPENTFDDFSFTARLPGNAPLALKGKRSAAGVELEANGERLPLAQFNPYVTQAAGYSIATGSATVGWKGHLNADRYDSETTLRFDRLNVAGAEGDSLFTQHFGIPLSLALGLMKDLHGVIALTVPISGDRAGGTRVDVGAVVAQALAHAILGAITSPLKLLGAVAFSGEKVDAFAPEPIGFAAGRAEVADDAWWRVEQLVNVLATYPGLGVELRGGAGPTDVRALQEAAVLASLQADQGVLGTLRNLPARAERNAIRDALIARAGGKTAELSPERQKTLDTWAAERSIGDGDLQKLADARAARLQALLGTDYGVDASRLAVGEPRVDRDQGQAAVGVAVR